MGVPLSRLRTFRLQQSGTYAVHKHCSSQVRQAGTGTWLTSSMLSCTSWHSWCSQHCASRQAADAQHLHLCRLFVNLLSCCRASGLLACRKCPPWNWQSSSMSALAQGKAAPVHASCSSIRTSTAFARRSAQPTSSKQTRLAQPMDMQLEFPGSFWKMSAARVAMSCALLLKLPCWHQPWGPSTSWGLCPKMAPPLHHWRAPA